MALAWSAKSWRTGEFFRIKIFRLKIFLNGLIVYSFLTIDIRFSFENYKYNWKKKKQKRNINQKNKTKQNPKLINIVQILPYFSPDNLIPMHVTSFPDRRAVRYAHGTREIPSQWRRESQQRSVCRLRKLGNSSICFKNFKFKLEQCPRIDPCCSCLLKASYYAYFQGNHRGPFFCSPLCICVFFLVVWGWGGGEGRGGGGWMVKMVIEW